MDGFECKQRNFQLDSGFERKPVLLLEDRRDVVKREDSGDDDGSLILD